MALLLVANKVMTGYPDSVVLESGQLVIGRLNTNHLVLSDGKVEPIHAMIEVDTETGVTSVLDMASEIGVYVNGEKVDVTSPIKSGDVIRIGDVEISVKHHELKDSAKGQPQDGTDAAKGQQPRVVNARILFTAEKERRTGSTLEVVAFWDQSILDVRHYGGEQAAGEELRSNKVVLGNEYEGDLIGVGPKANTRNLKLADVKGSKAIVYLNDEMRARVRRGARFEQIKGPSEVQLSGNDMALIQHGTISYFMTRVAMPNPVLRKVEELDGKPIIFAYATALYLVLAVLLGIANASAPPMETAGDEPWATQMPIRTPTPKPPNKAEPPAPKPTVAIKTPPPQKSTPKPSPTQPPKPQLTAKPVVNNTPRPIQRPESPAKTQGKVASEKPKAKDPALGPRDNKANAGNSGGRSGGTSGAMAAPRQGNDKNSNAGTETGKEDLLSLANLDKLGSDLGKTINASGAGEIATGVKSTSGGSGANRGSGKRGSFGMGGVGSGNSISSGGPGDALKGLGAGGLGAGGDGAGGRRGAGGAGKISIGAVSAPSGDSVVEGSLSKGEIEAVIMIRANLAKIQACYERRLQAKRDMAGRVLTKFVIAGNGRVSSANVEASDLGDGPTETCITSEIKRWQFPLPKGGGQVTVKFPFVFTPRS